MHKATLCHTVTHYYNLKPFLAGVCNQATKNQVVQLYWMINHRTTFRHITTTTNAASWHYKKVGYLPARSCFAL